MWTISLKKRDGRDHQEAFDCISNIQPLLSSRKITYFQYLPILIFLTRGLKGTSCMQWSSSHRCGPSLPIPINKPQAETSNNQHKTPAKMPPLRKILSLRNAMRLSGAIAVAVGAPLAIVPAFGVSLLLGKRTAPDHDKRALEQIMRATGIGIFATGFGSLIAKPNPETLLASAVMEGLYAIFHLANRFSGEWERAKGNMTTNALFAPAACLNFGVQVYALKWGDREEDE